MAGAVNTDAGHRHRLQQCTLSAWTRPVDLIGKHHLGEQRTGLKAEVSGALIKHIEAGEIRWQQITGEADTLKRQADTPGEGFGQRGFTGAGCVLDQQMPLGQQAAGRQLDLLTLAQQHRTNGVQQRLQLIQPSAVIHQL